MQLPVSSATLQWTARLIALSLAGLAMFGTIAYAQPPARSSADAAFVDHVKEAVLKELRDSGALDRAVDAGVDRYVERKTAEAEQKERSDAVKQAAKLRPVSKDRDHIRGNPEASVTLVEYSDFECPFCKRFHLTAKRLVDEAGGKVKWVYRHFPLEELHPLKAHREAVATECAAEIGGNAAFWKFADRFFELTPSNNRTDIDTVLPKIAAEVGLDKARFASCLASGRFDKRIAEDAKNAASTGGRGTPWSIIVSKSGKTYPLSGAQPYSVLKQLAELALEE